MMACSYAAKINDGFCSFEVIRNERQFLPPSDEVEFSRTPGKHCSGSKQGAEVPQ